MAKDLVKVGTPLEDRSSDSFEKSDGFKTLFNDSTDGEGVIVPPRSVLRMCIEKEEMPFCAINFLSKNNHHKKFNSWVDVMLAQPKMKKKLNDLGIMSSYLGQKNGGR